ncbi:MAG: hypothetical protein A2V84_08005 [Chloroflexi bacterium RBG_16_70_13]|nr:MAG: hypothetical protein A2V84_08005 [Chloroflexi bacterium RBG_16_70_13]
MSLLEREFDAALTAWLARQAAAEERLTAFAFREGQPAIKLPAPTSQTALRAWIVATVADPEVAAFLEGLGDEGRTMAELAAEGPLGLEPGDRVALAARVGVLAAAGVVARDLEFDRVALTGLGRAALALAAVAEPVR